MVYQKLAALLVLAPSTVFGFSPAAIPQTQQFPTSTSARHAIDPSSSVDLLNSASNWIATIDGDIANIPTNEFATVFAGGIVS